MIIDKETLLSDAQAITGDAASTNYYDTGSAADSGPGSGVKVFASVDTTFDNLTSLDIELQSDDNASFSSAKTLYKVNVLLAGLTSGTKVDLPDLPAGAERYLRAYYDVNGTDPTNGAITCGFILTDQKNTPTTD